MRLFSLHLAKKYANWGGKPQNKLQIQLDIATVKFSILSNFIALLGGKIKQKQITSGNMADILSNLYLGYALLWYHHHFPGHELLRDECIQYLMKELDDKMNLFVSNYPVTALTPFLYPIKNNIVYSKIETTNKLYSYISKNEELDEILNRDIYFSGTVLDKLTKLSKLNRSSQEYKSLYADIIQVGEYPIRELGFSDTKHQKKNL